MLRRDFLRGCMVTAAGLALPWIPERVYSFPTRAALWSDPGANPIADIRDLVLGMPTVEFAPALPRGGFGPYQSLGVLDAPELAAALDQAHAASGIPMRTMHVGEVMARDLGLSKDRPGKARVVHLSDNGLNIVWDLTGGRMDVSAG